MTSTISLVRNPNRRRALIVGALMFSLGCAGQALAGRPSRSPSAAAIRAALSGDLAGLTELDRTITATDNGLRSTPTSSSYDLLARLQLRRGRATGDAAAFVAALDASTASLRIAPKSLDSLVLNAEIRYANHDFDGARRVADDVLTRRTTETTALAIRADVAREVGHDEAAAAALEALISRAGSAPAVLVRRAVAASLGGKVEEAARLASIAEAGAPSSGLIGSDLAFFASFTAQLAFDRGDLSAAVAGYGRALVRSPGDRVASFGLARTLAAQQRFSDAERILRVLTDRFPDPAALMLLGDVEARLGRMRKAEEAYQLVDATIGIADANRRVYDRELVSFITDRRSNDRVQLARALSVAQATVATRKDVASFDALGWALYRSGRFDEAANASNKALRLGTKSALFHFHAGAIAAARGDRPRAAALLTEALRINPSFDVLGSVEARRLLGTVTR